MTNETECNFLTDAGKKMLYDKRTFSNPFLIAVWTLVQFVFNGYATHIYLEIEPEDFTDDEYLEFSNLAKQARELENETYELIQKMPFEILKDAVHFVNSKMLYKMEILLRQNEKHDEYDLIVKQEGAEEAQVREMLEEFNK